MVQRQQNVAEPIPPFFVRTLASLESALNTAKEKEAKKKMNASNARALTAMKQKVKKTAKEYEKEMQQFQTVCCYLFIVLLGCLHHKYRIRKPLNASMQLWPRATLVLRSQSRPKRLSIRRSKRMMTLPLLEKVVKPCSSLLRASSKICRSSRKLAAKRSVITSIYNLWLTSCDRILTALIKFAFWKSS